MKVINLLKKHYYISSISVLFITSIILNEVNDTHIASIAVMSILAILAGFHIFKKALFDLRYLIIGIDLLVTIAVIAAFIIGDYFEAAAVTYLFTLGHVLEKLSLEKTRSALKGLIDLKPTIARRLNQGQEEIISLSAVNVGDILVIKQGEKIPTDGEVIEGSGAIDEQMMTGESIPVDKTLGSSVYSSTILSSGYLKIKATKTEVDSSLSQIIHLVEEAHDKKAKTQKFMEVFAKYYTPGIVLLAILSYFIFWDIRLSITMIVIACPGALVIATPVSYVAGIGNAAKKGILFKGGDSIERLAKGKVIFFDKTGTLSQGKLELTNMKTYGISEEEALKIAAIGEAYSEHPLSLALIKEAKKRNIDINHAAEDVNLVIAKGIEFSFAKETYKIGNKKLFDFELPPLIESDMQQFLEQGLTTLIMSKGNEVISIFGIADSLRLGSLLLVDKLNELNIKDTIMLTGDAELVAKNVSMRLGLSTYYAGLFPQEKAAIIKKYDQSIFVGDGINDALALTYAKSSIAVGGLGKDLAMETADVVLMGEDILKVVDAIKISRKVRRNMIENITFSLLVVLVLIAGVIYKKVDMALGMLVHESSILVVLINAIRLLNYDLKRIKLWNKRN